MRFSGAFAGRFGPASAGLGAGDSAFFWLWLGQAVSAFGSRITTVAMPLLAVGLLGASPAEMGVLAALGVLPHLLFGLLAGVWVDRWPRRRLLVVADLGRACVVGSVPLLGLAGLLRIEHLYVVAFLSGLLSLLFEVAAASLVPALVGRASLVQANSALLLNGTLASTVGPSLGGSLVQVLTAPLAIAFDAASFVVSAVCSLRMRVHDEPADRGAGRADASVSVAVPPLAPAVDTPQPTATGLRSEALAGLRVLFGHPVLAPIVVSATLGAGAGAMQAALLVVYLVRDLGLAPAAVGLAMATTGLAAIVGALAAPAVIQRLGPGPSYLIGGLLAGLAGLLLAAAQGPPALVTVWLLAGQVAAGVGPSLYSVPQTTLRQSLVPDHLLGRANAAWRFLVFGVQPLGAIAGGTLGSTIGVRSTLVVASLGTLLACLYALRSPVRTVRTLPH